MTSTDDPTAKPAGEGSKPSPGPSSDPSSLPREGAPTLPSWMSGPDLEPVGRTPAPLSDPPPPWAAPPPASAPRPSPTSPPWAPPRETPPNPEPHRFRNTAWAPPMVVKHEPPGTVADPLPRPPSPDRPFSIAPGSPGPFSMRAPDDVPAAPPTAPLAPDAPPKLAAAAVLGGDRSTLGWFRDNLEAFAFAILLALLLRHLCIEVFKIPTKSMEPTLFGKNADQHPGTEGDRIAVDKMAYLFHGPSRWDVVVFRYPLDWTRNFIKRVTGLPGELLRIERGDIWTAAPPPSGKDPEYHPARKPKSVRDQLYVSVYPPRGTYATRLPSNFWRDDTVGGFGFSPLTSFDEFAFPGDHETRPGVEVPSAILRYGYPITDENRADRDPTSVSGGFPTPDLRVRGTIETTGPAECVIEWRPGDGRTHTLALASEGRGASYAKTLFERRPLPFLPTKGTTTFELESVDGDLRVTIDGEERAVLRDETKIAIADSLEASKDGSEPQILTLSVRGAPLVIRHVRIDHDLYYTSHNYEGRLSPETGDAWHIPEDAYFMMGDNTKQSNDSRLWNASGVRLKDGSEIWYDPSPSSDDDEVRYPRYLTVDGLAYQERRDVEGVVRRWSEADLLPGVGMLGKRVPFVPRERIVGRAWFAMYADIDVWPLKVPKVKTDGRIRFIH